LLFFFEFKKKRVD